MIYLAKVRALTVLYVVVGAVLAIPFVTSSAEYGNIYLLGWCLPSSVILMMVPEMLLGSWFFKFGDSPLWAAVIIAMNTAFLYWLATRYFPSSSRL